MTILLGKRYVCRVCGVHALCTRAADGELKCCGETMDIEQPKALPSAD